MNLAIKKYYKHFTSKKEMIKELSSLSDVFNSEAMVDVLKISGPRRLFIIKKDGQKIASDNFKSFISLINSFGGLKFIPTICFGRGDTYHLYSYEDYFKTEVETKEEVKPVETASDDIEDAAEDSTSVATGFEGSSSVLNMEEIQSLYSESDKRGSKDKLEQYARDYYGVDLNKRLSFDNMVEELKAAITISKE